MRTRRNTKKIVDLLFVLTRAKHHWLSAKDIADLADMSHEAVLAWLYELHDAKLVECVNEVPRKWRWA